MTGLVLLSDPPTQEHLRFRLRFSKTNAAANGRAKPPADELLFWDRRGLGSVSLYSAAEFAAKFEGENTTLGPDALRLSARAAPRSSPPQPPGDQSRFARSTRRCRHRKSICVGNVKRGRHPPGRCAAIGYAANSGIACMLPCAGAGGGHPPRGFNAGRRNLSQRAQRSRRLSKSSPRLRPCRGNLPHLPPRHHPPHRASTAIHLFLPKLPAPLRHADLPTDQDWGLITVNRWQHVCCCPLLPLPRRGGLVMDTKKNSGSKSKSACPDCDADFQFRKLQEFFNRRDFVKTAGIATASALAAGAIGLPSVIARAAEATVDPKDPAAIPAVLASEPASAKAIPETLVKQLYDSLRPEQRKQSPSTGTMSTPSAACSAPGLATTGTSHDRTSAASSTAKISKKSFARFTKACSSRNG